MENNYIILHALPSIGEVTVHFDNKFHYITLDRNFYNLSLIEKSRLIINLFDQQKQNYIVFYPGVDLFSLSASLFKMLKHCQFNPICILYLTDSIDRIAHSVISMNEMFSYFKIFDYVFTFDLYEAKKYGFLYHHEPVKIFPYVNNVQSDKYGVVFLSRAKGREELLFDIARYLQKNNIVYNFYLFAPNLVIPSDILSIHLLDKVLQYQDFIQTYVQHCSCRLDITSQNAHGVTLGGYEGVIYNKKVIYTCEDFAEYPFYDQRFMRKISKAEDIDIDWIKDQTPVKYNYDITRFRMDQHLATITNIVETKKNAYNIFLTTNTNNTQNKLAPIFDTTREYSLAYKYIRGHLPAYRIYFRSNCGQRFNDADLLYFRTDTVMEMFSGIWQGNNLCTLGSFSYICSPIRPFMQIGRYVSVDSGLSILPDSHPQQWASTSPFTYFDKPRFFKIPLQTEFTKFISPVYQPEEEKIVIENDVWIGKNVSLQKGISICNGAIVSHNAVVIEDVPPYAIVSGSPAKVIGFRFKPYVIARLLELQWWKYNITDLNGLHFNNIELFLDEFTQLKPSLEPFELLKFKPFEIYKKLTQNEKTV